MGLNVETYALAEEFPAHLGRPASVCLVLALRMPVIERQELLQGLVDRGQRMSIVLITVYEDQQARTEALAAGVMASLQKPFDDRTLLEAVRRAQAQGKEA